jgi:hypothetical protein
MGTTVDDLIDLKDQAVALAYQTVESVLFVFGESDGAMGELIGQAREVIERAELYDAADEDELAVSIEDHERLEHVCEIAECAHRDPDGKRDHKIRDHDEEQA